MNAFLDLADRQIAAPVKAKLRAAEKRRSEREKKNEQEACALSAAYRWQRQRDLDDALAGPGGEVLRALLAQLDTMTRETIPIVTAFVQAGGLHTAGADLLFLARRLTSEHIILLREKDGLVPFDDPLPGEPATPEQDLRAAFADQSSKGTIP